jgi:hypothetical protein
MIFIVQKYRDILTSCWPSVFLFHSCFFIWLLPVPNSWHFNFSRSNVPVAKYPIVHLNSLPINLIRYWMLNPQKCTPYNSVGTFDWLYTYIMDWETVFIIQYDGGGRLHINNLSHVNRCALKFWNVDLCHVTFSLEKGKETLVLMGFLSE